MPILMFLLFLTSQTGMINLPSHALFIHPLPSHLAQDYGSANTAQSHVIYKRSLKDIVGQTSDVVSEGRGSVFILLYFKRF